MATVYLLHFAQPYQHAQHYIGYTASEDVYERFERHRTGRGANLLRVVVDAGINLMIARLWVGAPRKFELKLKAMGGAAQLCPICRGQQVFKRGRLIQRKRAVGKPAAQV